MHPQAVTLNHCCMSAPTAGPCTWHTSNSTCNTQVGRCDVHGQLATDTTSHAVITVGAAGLRVVDKLCCLSSSCWVAPACFQPQTLLVLTGDKQCQEHMEGWFFDALRCNYAPCPHPNCKKRRLLSHNHVDHRSHMHRSAHMHTSMGSIHAAGPPCTHLHAVAATTPCA